MGEPEMERRKWLTPGNVVKIIVEWGAVGALCWSAFANIQRVKEAPAKIEALQKTVEEKNQQIEAHLNLTDQALAIHSARQEERETDRDARLVRIEHNVDKIVERIIK
jgi:type VI protein secretion system component VasK